MASRQALDGVLDRVTALLAPKSFHSLLSFSSLSGTPFWCCCGAVDSCSPIRCSALNCCLNRVISSPSFGRLLSHHPIDCPHGPPSPSISAIPPDYSSLQDQTGLLGLPFRTVVFLAAIAFLCPDALRSNNRSFPFMRCCSWVLPSTRFPMIVNLCPNTAPTVSIIWWRQEGKLERYQPRFGTNMVHRGHECEPPSESWPPGSGKP